MASVEVPRRAISKYEAERQFDQLFDEYFNTGTPVFLTGENYSFKGDVHLESGKAEESDEVYHGGENVGGQQAEDRQAICDVAHQLRSLGDKYAETYGQDLSKANNVLTNLFTKVASLEYTTFKNTIEGVTPHDQNAADFVFVMCVSRHVVEGVGGVANKAKNFFRRYIGDNYIDAMADAGGVVRFVGERS